MDDYQDIVSAESSAKDPSTDAESSNVELVEKVDSIQDSVTELDGKVQGVSDNVDSLVRAGADDGASGADYTEAIAQIHEDIGGLQEMQSYTSLLLVVLCSVVFLAVGIMFGNTIVKWLRFNNG